MRKLVTIGCTIILLGGAAVPASARGGAAGGVGGCGHAGGHAGPAGANSRILTGSYYCQPGICQTSASVRPPPR